ncbi:MAG: carbohydrate deacetylase, partial [Candidatus Binatia bacterium]
CERSSGLGRERLISDSRLMEHTTSVSTKYLIVNADDFGQGSGINRGIVAAHEHGIVTSASFMTRWPAAEEAARYSREHPDLSVGLHLDLGEWVYNGENWVPLYTVVALDDPAAVEREIHRQVDAFYDFIGRLPAHINSHQHIHMREPAHSVALQICQSLGIPLRNVSTELHYFTKFYGQTAEGLPFPTYISVDWLIEILSHLIPDGWTVLTCHPGYVDDIETMYRLERLQELKVLCDPRVKAVIDTLGIKLCSFNDWKHRLMCCQ